MLGGPSSVLPELQDIKTSKVKKRIILLMYFIIELFFVMLFALLYFRASLLTPFCFPTWAFFQLLRYQNTHLAMLNSVFGALHLKKLPAFVFQKELIEVPFINENNITADN